MKFSFDSAVRKLDKRVEEHSFFSTLRCDLGRWRR